MSHRPKELLSHPLCEKLSLHSIDHCGRVHLKETMGLRLKTGIERGPAKSHPHPTTGFMAYRGKVINRAARITKLASGGQVYISNGVWEAAKHQTLMTELDVQWRSMGTQKLKVVYRLALALTDCRSFEGRRGFGGCLSCVPGSEGCLGSDFGGETVPLDWTFGIQLRRRILRAFKWTLCEVSLSCYVRAFVAFEGAPSIVEGGCVADHWTE